MGLNYLHVLVPALTIYDSTHFESAPLFKLINLHTSGKLFSTNNISTGKTKKSKSPMEARNLLREINMFIQGYITIQGRKRLYTKMRGMGTENGIPKFQLPPIHIGL